MNTNIKVLHIEDNPADARIVKEMLVEQGGFDLTNVESLEKGIKHLKEKECDIVLLDLNLPDSNGLDTFLSVRSQKASTPIIILTGLDDKERGPEAVRQGAQDYLIKGSFDSELLTHSIRYSIERHKLLYAMEKLEVDNYTLKQQLQKALWEINRLKEGRHEH